MGDVGLRSERFAACWERVDRARLHLRTFSQIWNTHLEDEPFRVQVNMSPDGTGAVTLEPKPPPTDLALELGEMLYHLRAALDGCIYETAVHLTGQDPPPQEHRLEFPVCDTETAFDQAINRGKLTSLTDEHIKHIRTFQPFRIDPAMPPDTWWPTRALQMINDWARKDRHRRLHIVGSWAVEADPDIQVEPPGRLAALVPKYGKIISDPYEVARFQVANYAPGMSVQVSPRLAIDVAVDTGPYPEDENDSLSRRMRLMCSAVEIMIEMFEVGVGLRPVQAPPSSALS